MEQYRKTMITFAVLILVIFGLYYFSDWFSKTTGYVLGEDEKEKLATCLNEKNAVLYTSRTCPDCESQLELFGNAKDNINTILCEKAQECPEGGVPAWQIGKQIVYGVKNFEELIKISGCNLN